MMRLDELSDALHQQADTVHDGGTADRLQSVRGRVRAARRRRTAAVSAAVVAAIALVGVGVLPGLGGRDSGPADAPAVLAGHDVPGTLEAEGFRYEYAEGVAGEPGENPLELEVEVGDQPRLVSFASSESGSTLLAESDQGAHMGGASGGFSTHLLLEPGPGSETVTLRQLDGLAEGTLALAVYDLVDEPPAGVSDGEHTFRDRVADWSLVDGRIGAPGDNEVTFTVTLPEGPLRWDTMCRGGGEGMMLKLSVQGTSGWIGSGCGDGGPLGPDATDSSTETVGDDPAPRNRPVEVRVWLGPTDGGAGQVAEDTDVVLGLAVYSLDGSKEEVLGQRIDSRFEAAGHTWEVAEVDEMPRSQERYALTLPAAQEARMVRMVVTHADDRTVELRNGVTGVGEDSVRMVSPGATTGATVLGPFMVLPGKDRTVSLEFDEGWTPDARVSLVTATLAD